MACLIILLMRHGADDNTRLGGWSDAGLSSLGVVQACKAYLNHKGILASFRTDSEWHDYPLPDCFSFFGFACCVLLITD